jgi:ParB family chromosome partitioning protein
MFEEARSIKGMMEMLKITQDEMARKLGVSQSYIANKLRLLKLGEEAERLVVDGGLTERHARCVLRLEDPSMQLSALSKIRERRLTVAESEALVSLLHDGGAPERIGRAQRLKIVDSFRENLHRSVETVISLGLGATETVSHYGKKTYITVCIDEG